MDLSPTQLEEVKKKLKDYGDLLTFLAICPCTEEERKAAVMAQYELDKYRRVLGFLPPLPGKKDKEN